MTLLDRFNKQPDEIKKYQIDYSEWVVTGETVDSVATAVELLNPAAGDVGEPTLAVGTTNLPGGNIFEYFLSLGTDGKRYKITFLADTSDSQTVESEIEFKVNDL
jgi:hypothetical protein